MLRLAAHSSRRIDRAYCLRTFQGSNFRTHIELNLRFYEYIYVSCGVGCVERRWSSFKYGRSSFDVGIRKADT